LVQHGNSRVSDINEFQKYDIILTTYGTLVSDEEMISKFKFDYAILDESQAIKNPLSKRFKAVCTIQSENKLVLTGTPIENNTFDLFSQMHFANPGLLGSKNHFKETYSDAIDKNKDEKMSLELSKIIHPFILRRTKKQVATDLPEKTESILYCEMGEEQRNVYSAFRNKYRDILLGKFEEEGFEKSKMYVLEGLTKLRQICDSPAILPDEENYGSASAKLDELMKHIQEKTGNHKILIFSQFVKMLKLIEAKMVSEKISYTYLDGKSTDRKKLVNQFQEDDNTRVFLISLKAGGTGLNLTAADYVYIVDPWWNPAVEAQAIDRCYRIGQEKHVFAYKMICKDTVEEKIIQLQQSKKSLSEDIIKTDDAFFKTLKKDEIIELFS
jgi:non-specific serine/threonine protein kinase